MGAETHNLVPHGHFRTNDDRWLAVTCSSDKMFARLAQMIGDPVLLDPGLATTRARMESRAAINGVVIGWIGARSAVEVQAACDAGGVPCSLLYSVADIFADPHYAARGDLLSLDDGVNGPLTVPAPFPKLSATPAAVSHLGLPLGASNREIYEGLLGMGADEIAALSAAGTI
jgi:crotonobetainyl-CoA:carnitine CoA-transferase CaiB-like acyl-CoA transferase